MVKLTRLSPTDRASILYANKSDALSPIHYTIIQYTWKLSSNGYVYIKTKKGMYVLKQATVLTYNNLVKDLAPHGYVHCKYSTSLWRHATKKLPLRRLIWC